MTTKVTFNDAEPLAEWAVVSNVTISGEKINLDLEKTDFFEVSHVIDTVNRREKFEIADVDFQNERLTVRVTE